MADFPYNRPTQPHLDGSDPPSLVRRARGVLAGALQTIGFAAVLFVLVNFVTARIRVEGDSMEPSLYDGQFVVVNRLAYALGELERGDIIVFRFPLNPERRFIKRVIGLPGDRVEARDGEIYVNGSLIDEPYLTDPPTYNDEWVVGFDEVFVLGDNRNNSSDSQNWGALPLDGIIGKAFLVYWPIDTMGWIPHYDLAAADQG